jgi:mannose-1-phosphate guanylyltransferase/mannose-6-phosphate isomerase
MATHQSVRLFDSGGGAGKATRVISRYQTPGSQEGPDTITERVPSNIVPVVLAGGSGTRLWPLSRAMLPKQFVRFFGGESASFLEATLKRLTDFAPPLIMCNNDHRFLVREAVERIGIAPRSIILEPVARNTAAAIAVAALYLERHEKDAILAVLPADHLLTDEKQFSDHVKRAADLAARGKLVLFGIKPTEAHTGYGYIRRGAPLDGCNGSAFAIDAFFEKPSRVLAEHYVAVGGYQWNSGIFVMGVEAFIGELALREPAVLEAARAALADAKEDLGFLRLDRQALAAAPDVSVDRAVMEKTSAAAVLPFDGGWSDIGSWSSLWEVSRRDKSGNYAYGEVLLEDTSDCYVHSEKALVATLGVHDLVIVDTSDAVLVADKSRAQDVSKIVARLRRSNRREPEQHLRNLRPWGYFEPLSIGPRFQVKLLHVKPGAKLSLQMHYHRSEHWTVVQGTARVVVGGAERFVGENESVHITATQWHRLENPGKVPLEVIEVQVGSYLGEDDIMRSEDVYHRSPDETR